MLIDETKVNEIMQMSINKVVASDHSSTANFALSCSIVFQFNYDYLQLRQDHADRSSNTIQYILNDHYISIFQNHHSL